MRHKLVLNDGDKGPGCTDSEDPGLRSRTTPRVHLNNVARDHNPPNLTLLDFAHHQLQPTAVPPKLVGHMESCTLKSRATFSQRMPQPPIQFSSSNGCSHRRAMTGSPPISICAWALLHSLRLISFPRSYRNFSPWIPSTNDRKSRTMRSPR